MVLLALLAILAVMNMDGRGSTAERYVLLGLVALAATKITHHIVCGVQPWWLFLLCMFAAYFVALIYGFNADLSFSTLNPTSAEFISTAVIGPAATAIALILAGMSAYKGQLEIFGHSVRKML